MSETASAPPFLAARAAQVTSVMLGDVPLSSALQPVPGAERLVVLPAGPTPPNPAEMLASKRPTEVLWALQMNCDIVLVDSPAVLPVTDGVVASAEAQKQDLESAQLPFHDSIVRRLDSLEAAFGSESESDRKANYVPA